MTAQIKVKVQRKAIVKVKVLPRFPSSVTGDGGVTVTRDGGNYIIGLEDVPLASLETGGLGYAMTGNGDGVPSTYQGFTQAGTGAVVRGWQDKARDVLHAKDFGAVWDGVTDDTVAINKLHAAANVLGRCEIVYPAGIGIVSTLTTLTGSVKVRGSGPLGTIIVTNSATGTVMTLSGDYAMVSDIGFDSSVTKTAGYHISLSGFNQTVRNVSSKHAFVALYNTGRVTHVTGCTFELMTSRALAANSGGILNEGGLINISQTVVSGATVTAAAFPEFGYKSIGNASGGEINLVGCAAYLTRVGLYSTSSATGNMNGTKVSACWFDGHLERACYIDSTPGFSNSPIDITGTWFSAGYGASAITAVVEFAGATTGTVQMLGNKIFSSSPGSGVGIYLNTGGAIRFTGAGNLVGDVGGGFASNILIADNASHVTFVGGAAHGGVNGFVIGATVTYVSLTGMDLTGNTTAFLNFSSGGTGIKYGLCPGVDNETGTGDFVHATSPTLQISASVQSTTAGAAVGPIFSTYRNTAAPANNDLIGTVDFSGNNSSGSPVNYARAMAKIIDKTAASEDGQLIVQTPINGTLADRCTIGQGAQLGAPTGGDPGSGSLNAASDILVNNVSVVRGSLGATDNAALRADGTGTKTSQGSALIIADTTGALSRSGAGGIPIQGTNSNVASAAGDVGQYISSSIASGSAVNVADSSATEITHIDLTAGNWLIWGNLTYTPPGGITTTIQGAFIHTSVALPTPPNDGAYNVLQQYGNVGSNTSIATGMIRKSFASTTSVYLVAYSDHSSGNVPGYGFIGAIRLP